MFYKTSEVVKEEARLAELRRLFDTGMIDLGQYMDAIRGLKATVEGREFKSANALDILQLGLLAAIVGAVVYGVKQFK